MFIGWRCILQLDVSGIRSFCLFVCVLFVYLFICLFFVDTPRVLISYETEAEDRMVKLRDELKTCGYKIVMGGDLTGTIMAMRKYFIAYNINTFA